MIHSGPPTLEFYREDTLIDNADIGMIEFTAKNSADNDTTYVRIIGQARQSQEQVRKEVD